MSAIHREISSGRGAIAFLSSLPNSEHAFPPFSIDDRNVWKPALGSGEERKAKRVGEGREGTHKQGLAKGSVCDAEVRRAEKPTNLTKTRSFCPRNVA